MARTKFNEDLLHYHPPSLLETKKNLFFSKTDGIITGYMTAIEKIAELKVAKYSHDLKNADSNISKLRLICII